MRALLHARSSRQAPLALLLALVWLGGCSSGQAGHATRTPTLAPPGAPTATSTPRLLYQADWSKSLSAWQATAGWSIQNGALQSDTGQDRTVTIPYQPETSNYAIDYTMQIVKPLEGGECDIAAAPTPAKDGYEVRLYDMLALGNSEFALHPQFGVSIDPLGDQDTSIGITPWVDFELGGRVTTYRIEVRGALATVLVNGRRISPAAQSVKTSTLSNGPLTFTCSLASARFSSVTVSSL